MGACNPFSPAYDENLDSGSSLSDLTTVEGVFKNFQYAYTFQDTIIYGQLISQDFIFSFRNFNEDQVFDDSWGREEEMLTTYGMFQNTQSVSLIWNNVILSTEDSLTATVVRGFNLTVTLNPTNIYRVDGRVNMALAKNPDTGKWAITRWVDESDF
jgi:hypothetical protein